MTVIKKVTVSDTYMGKLKHGEDLLTELTNICKEKNIQLGRVEAIGAVTNACVGFYDHLKRSYDYITYNEGLEILNLTGNISLKDGEPMVHAHVILSDDEGKAFGGHLAPGTTIFACEYVLTVFEGQVMTREFDEETGLPLWAIK